MVAAGGTYEQIPIDKAFVDGNLVTAPAWPAHPAWLAAFLEVLGESTRRENRGLVKEWLRAVVAQFELLCKGTASAVP